MKDQEPKTFIKTRESSLKNNTFKTEIKKIPATFEMDFILTNKKQRRKRLNSI